MESCITMERAFHGYRAGKGYAERQTDHESWTIGLQAIQTPKRIDISANAKREPTRGFVFCHPFVCTTCRVKALMQGSERMDEE